MKIDIYPNLGNLLEDRDPRLAPYKTALIDLQRVVLAINEEVEKLKQESEQLKRSLRSAGRFTE